MNRLSLALIVLALGCGPDDPSVPGLGSGTDTGSGSSSGTSDGLSASGGANGSNTDSTGAVTTQGLDDTGTSGSATTGGGMTTMMPTTAASSDGAEAEGTSGDAGSTSDAGTTGDTGPETTGADGCGDGNIDPGEQCDGANLQGFDCGSLGLGEGNLACDPVMCTFDTSMCMGGGGTGFASL